MSSKVFSSSATMGAQDQATVIEGGFSSGNINAAEGGSVQVTDGGAIAGSLALTAQLFDTAIKGRAAESETAVREIAGANKTALDFAYGSLTESYAFGNEALKQSMQAGREFYDKAYDQADKVLDTMGRFTETAFGMVENQSRVNASTMETAVEAALAQVETAAGQSLEAYTPLFIAGAVVAVVAIAVLSSKKRGA